MNDAPIGLCAKIARLVQERGWSRQTFARQAGLHRLTVSRILAGVERRLHAATVEACAKAFGFTALELRSESTERLLGRRASPYAGAEAKQRLFEETMPPEVREWLRDHPDRVAQLSPEEVDELLSLRESSEPLTAFAVSELIHRIERRRRLMQKVSTIAGTEFVDFLETLVDLVHDKIQPYRDRR